jgi:hypothetical protein
MIFSPVVAIFLYYFIANDENLAPSFIFCSLHIKLSSEMLIITYFIPFIYLLPCWTVTFCYFEIARKAYKNLCKL